MRASGTYASAVELFGHEARRMHIAAKRSRRRQTAVVALLAVAEL